MIESKRLTTAVFNGDLALLLVRFATVKMRCRRFAARIRNLRLDLMEFTCQS